MIRKILYCIEHIKWLIIGWVIGLSFNYKVFSQLKKMGIHPQYWKAIINKYSYPIIQDAYTKMATSEEKVSINKISKDIANSIVDKFKYDYYTHNLDL